MTSDDTLNPIPEIKATFKRASQNRYKLVNKYRVDRWMFQAGMFLVFAWLFFVAHWYHYDMDFYQCGNPDVDDYMHNIQQEDCRNPFYKPGQAWKGQEYLPPGKYGTQLGPMFRSAFYSPFLIFGLVFGLNHLINNRRQKK